MVYERSMECRVTSAGVASVGNSRSGMAVNLRRVMGQGGVMRETKRKAPTHTNACTSTHKHEHTHAQRQAQTNTNTFLLLPPSLSLFLSLSRPLSRSLDLSLSTSLDLSLGSSVPVVSPSPDAHVLDRFEVPPCVCQLRRPRWL